MAFSIKEFWNNADRKAGFAKPNRFKVKLIIPSVITADARALELQCETVDLPGKILTTQDVKVYGPAYRMAINKQYSNEITMNFLCTNDGHERNIFDKWLEYINSNNTNNLIYPESYLSNISITQYNETYDGKNESKSKIINEIELLKCFPVSYGPQSLNWGDDGAQRLSVQFSFRTFQQLT
jgi:hypothetical protein